jgi:hypothetical protein
MCGGKSNVRNDEGIAMRRMIVVAILCVISTPAFASCIYDSECPSGSSCVDGDCRQPLSSDEDNANAPSRDRVNGAKYCQYDDDCSEGSRCIKGSGREGVCLGH